MAHASYCNACGAHNPRGMASCQTCGCASNPPVRQNPVTSAEFANTKLVVFDIDRTILDTKERHRSAIRAGVQPKDFNYKIFTKMSKKDKKKREDFMYREDMLAKDRLMPNAMALIEHLMKEGYTIAYCTGRSFKWFEKTKNQLESKGFPLFTDSTGKTLLFLRKSESMSKGPYKAGVIKNLLNQYDVRLVFDDTVEVLQEASRLGVPGVYPSINDYWGMISPRSNPKPKVGYHKGQPYVYGTDSMEYAYQQMPDPDDPDGRTVGETSYARSNPIKRGKDSKGTYMRWGKATGKKYYYKAGNKKAREAARKKAQKQAQAAYAGGYRGNPSHSEDYMVPRDIHKLGKAADSLEETYIDGMEVPEWWKSKLSVTAKDADTIADSLDYVANNPNYDLLPIYSGKPSGRSKNLGAIFAEVFIGRNIFKDVGEVVQSIYRGLIGGRTSMAEARMTMAIAAMEKELSDRASKLGGNAVANLKLDYEIVQQTASLTIIATADALKVTPAPKKTKIKTNPASPSKVNKGKKLYKHMNGKDPAKVTKMTIDTGDVWYQVGEGGCWEIGYCSGKETGNSMQKYVHKFNEETKDGNLPNLYATMPDNGKPMLIITGGTWKIKTDENGVAWIYD